MIPAFLLIFIAIGSEISHIASKSRSLVWVWVVMVFGFLSVLSLVRLSIGYYHTDRIALGVQTCQEYLRTLPQTASYFGLVEGSARFSAPGDRLLIVGDARSLYYSDDLYANSVFDDQVLSVLARSEKDAEWIYKRLRQMGIDELVVSGEEGMRLAGQYPSYYPLRPAEWKKLDDLIQQRTDLLYLSGVQGIYHLRSSPAVRKKPIPDLLLVLKTPNPNP
jgi:hypothetical protein